MISFVLYILAISITIQYTLAQNPVCDGSQIVYATPPSIDPLTGEIIGAGLDTITLSVDGENTFISNIIGIASDMFEMVPDQQPEMEMIRSASINPLTTDLVLLFQEINYADPLMNEPKQTLVIIPGFKLNSLLVPSPGILGYVIDENIDLSETELDQEYPLTEIAFDCAGNLLGVTAQGELVQMIIEPGSSDLETRYIGPVQFQGGIVGLSMGFVGLTYDFQTNVFVATGGVPIANTLVQFAVSDCTVIQFGNPIIITDQYALCPLGIVDIESRGNNQFYITCAIDANTFGLAILELIEGRAEILPINAADGQSLVVLPNSSGGALIPSIPSSSSAANTNANAICFPRNIGSPVCNVVPHESDCEGDINIELVMAPPGAGFVPPGLATGANIAPPVVDAAPQTGVSVNPVSGTYGYGAPADYGTGVYGTGATAYPQTVPAVGAVGTVGATGTGLGTSFNGEVIPGTEATAFGSPAIGGLGLGLGLGDSGEGVFGDDFGSVDDVDLSFDAQGSSVEDGDDTDNESEEEEEDVADDDTSADDVSEDDDESVSDDDTSADDVSEDDDDTVSDDDDDTSSDDVSDDDDDSMSDDDGGSDDEDSLDGDGDESVDDDDETDRDSVDPFSFDFERGSAEDAQLNGNNFNRNGFLAEDGYNNGQGTMISLSPSTLANLWGLAMIFLGINVTFLCICYYRNGSCQKKQVTVDDNDGDIESL